MRLYIKIKLTAYEANPEVLFDRWKQMVPAIMTST